jgi:hypothetical protein
MVDSYSQWRLLIHDVEQDFLGAVAVRDVHSSPSWNRGIRVANARLPCMANKICLNMMMYTITLF